MQQTSLFPQPALGKSKSDAYRFLFENLYFSPIKASRSLQFKNLPKISNKATKVDAGRSVNAKDENLGIAGIKEEIVEVEVNSHTDHSAKNLHQNTMIENIAENVPFGDKGRRLSFSDVNLFNNFKNDDCEMQFDQIPMGIGNPGVVLDNENADDIFIASEGYLSNGNSIDFTYNYENPESTEYVLGVAPQNYDKNDEEKNQTRKDTEVLVDHFSVGNKTDELIKWHSDVKRKRCKSKSNSFALGRTCFRGMSNYYKDKFETVLKSWEKNTNIAERGTMENLIVAFIKSEFGYDDDFYNSPKFYQFLNGMFTILHSQNYKKQDDYILKQDFTVIRNLLYCYSSHAKKAFLGNKNYSMIFSNFYIKGSEALVKQKTLNKYVGYKDELREELEDIQRAACLSVAK